MDFVMIHKVKINILSNLLFKVLISRNLDAILNSFIYDLQASLEVDAGHR
jgi:hypothetical protein